jgi:perosamine synthetase
MEPLFGEEEGQALNEYMSSGGWVTEFKKTEEFEKSIADYTKSKHCIAVNNGTVSLTLSALACGIKAGDEVIVPNYTMIATPNSMKMFGAIPVFVDVEPETLCLNIELTRKAITNRTKAIILVSANGRYPIAGINIFLDIAEKYNIALIEDSAQSLGSFYQDGRHIGTIGQVGSFSFAAPKIISTGQGGMVITNDDYIAFNLRRLKDFGRSISGQDWHDTIGYNFKFTDIQSVIGIEQMRKLPLRVERKKKIMKLYRKLLKDISQIQFFYQDLKHTTPMFIDVLVEKRAELQSFLKEKKIGTRIMYPPINKQKAYQMGGEHPVSNMVGKKGLWLPSASNLSDNQIQYICESIKEFYTIN